MSHANYWGLVNGIIPTQSIPDPFIFLSLHCDFIGHYPRWTNCGCPVHFTADTNEPITRGECMFGGDHTNDYHDQHINCWEIHRHHVGDLQRVVDCVERNITVSEYIELDEYRNVVINRPTDDTSVESMLFRWIICSQLIHAFSRFVNMNTIEFNSDNFTFTYADVIV